jgi:hypothetical protein
MADGAAELHADPYAGLEESDPELKRRIDVAIEVIGRATDSEKQRLGEPLRDVLRASIVECETMIEQRRVWGTIPLTAGDRKAIETKRQLLRRVLSEFRHVDQRLMYEWGLLAKLNPTEGLNVDFVAALTAAIPRMKRTLDDYDKRTRVTRRPKTIDDEECARAALNFLSRLGRAIERGGKEYIRLTLAFAGKTDHAKRVTKMRTACGEVYDQELAAAKAAASSSVRKGVRKLSRSTAAPRARGINVA